MKYLLAALFISLVLHSTIFISWKNHNDSKNLSKIKVKLNTLKKLNPKIFSEKNQISKIKEDSNTAKNDLISPKIDNSQFMSYLELIAHSVRNKIPYPVKAKRLKQEDDIIVEIKIARTGNIISHQFIKPAKFQAFTSIINESLSKMRLSPPPKELLENEVLTLNIPIEFKL
jgi:TonB family protein